MDSSARAEMLLAELHLGRLDRSPLVRTALGKGDAPPYWPLDSESDRGQRRSLLQQEAERLEDLDQRGLSPRERLHIRAAARLVANELEALDWADHEPLLSRTRGLHVAGPQLLRDLPNPLTEAELRVDFARLSQLGPALRQVAAQLNLRRDLGTLPPRRVIERARATITSLLRGAPFDQAVATIQDPMAPSDGLLLAELRRRMDSIDQPSDADRRAWMREATRVLSEDVGPAYRALDLTLEELAPGAPIEVGCWARSRGRSWYATRVARATDMDLEPADLHGFGLREVARLRDELRQLQKQLGSENSLERFLDVLRQDERLSLPADGAGRAALVEDVTRWSGAAAKLLPDMLTPPLNVRLEVRICPAPLVPVRTPIRWIPATRGTSYDGVLCVETSGWDPIPRWIGPAWTSAAGLPGEALRQRYLAQTRTLPDLLRYADAPALQAGWGLFAARQAESMGLISSPYDKVGRLVFELWHASLLVADTGLHALRWSRLDAVDYLYSGTSFPREVCNDAVMHIVEEPGEVCAATAGLRVLLDLERQAKDSLGDNYSSAAFHAAVLAAGPLPMDLVAEAVELGLRGR